MLSFAIHCVLCCGGKNFWISIQLLPINRWRIYPSYGGNKSEVWSLVSIFFGGFINGNCFFGIFVVVFSITSKENFMSRSRFNKLRFNIGLLPKLWSYFKQIWKERRSYNFYSFYGHWVTSFLCWVKDVPNIYFSGFPSLGQQGYSKTEVDNLSERNWEEGTYANRML